MEIYDVDVAQIRPPNEAVLRMPSEVIEPSDPATVSLLEAWAPGAEGLSDAATSLAGDAAVAAARGQHGVHESGCSNCGIPHERYVRYFGDKLPPLPWCAFFVSWCFATSGHRPPWRNPGYVGSIHEWATSNGRLVQEPAHGDIFGISDSHCGLVAGANPSAGQIFTVEGNWSQQVLSRLLSYRGTGIWFARF
jgi:hypothetical protein